MRRLPITITSHRASQAPVPIPQRDALCCREARRHWMSGERGRCCVRRPCRCAPGRSHTLSTHSARVMASTHRWMRPAQIVQHVQPRYGVRTPADATWNCDHYLLLHSWRPHASDATRPVYVILVGRQRRRLYRPALYLLCPAGRFRSRSNVHHSL